MTRTVYLDNAATTPTRPEVLQAMLPFLSDESFGNPSSAHGVGRRARDAVARAREQIAASLGVDPNHVIFTAGGTEADNIAVIGGALAARARGAPFRVAVSTIEHPAVIEAAHAVEALGGEAIFLPVDSLGRVLIDSLHDALERGVGLVSTMWVNNEVGFTQDISDLANRCAEAGVIFHTDAVQAVGKVPCSIADVPCTLFSLAGHKLGGPQGAGALIVTDRKAVDALTHGGGQQFGIRPGTENVAGWVGLGEAVEMAVSEVGDAPTTFGALRDDFERRLLDAVPDALVMAKDADRAPHVSSVVIPGIDSEALSMHLDLAGISCSTGSACHTGTVEPSKVLTALGVPADQAIRAMRFSFFKQNTEEDVDRVIEVLPGLVTKVRTLAESLGR